MKRVLFVGSAALVLGLAGCAGTSSRLASGGPGAGSDSGPARVGLGARLLAWRGRPMKSEVPPAPSSMPEGPAGGPEIAAVKGGQGTDAVGVDPSSAKDPVGMKAPDPTRGTPTRGSLVGGRVAKYFPMFRRGGPDDLTSQFVQPAKGDLWADSTRAAMQARAERAGEGSSGPAMAGAGAGSKIKEESSVLPVSMEVGAGPAVVRARPRPAMPGSRMTRPRPTAAEAGIARAPAVGLSRPSVAALPSVVAEPPGLGAKAEAARNAALPEAVDAGPARPVVADQGRGLTAPEDRLFAESRGASTVGVADQVPAGPQVGGSALPGVVDQEQGPRATGDGVEATSATGTAPLRVASRLPEGISAETPPVPDLPTDLSKADIPQEPAKGVEPAPAPTLPAEPEPKAPAVPAPVPVPSPVPPDNAPAPVPAPAPASVPDNAPAPVPAEPAPPTTAAPKPGAEVKPPLEAKPAPEPAPETMPTPATPKPTTPATATAAPAGATTPAGAGMGSELPAPTAPEPQAQAPAPAPQAPLVSNPVVHVGPSPQGLATPQAAAGGTKGPKTSGWLRRKVAGLGAIGQKGTGMLPRVFASRPAAGPEMAAAPAEKARGMSASDVVAANVSGLNPPPPLELLFPAAYYVNPGSDAARRAVSDPSMAMIDVRNPGALRGRAPARRRTSLLTRMVAKIQGMEEVESHPAGCLCGKHPKAGAGGVIVPDAGKGGGAALAKATAPGTPGGFRGSLGGNVTGPGAGRGVSRG